MLVFALRNTPAQQRVEKNKRVDDTSVESVSAPEVLPSGKQPNQECPDNDSGKGCRTSRRLTRWLWIGAGTFCVGAGIIGIFLPLLPTTPFLLLAAACYARGSNKFYDWLLANRWFGSYIRNYREGNGIPLRIKVFSISLLWATILCSAVFAVDILWIRVILVLIAVGVTAHILSIKTLRH